MKIKTSELTGAALDWAVVIALGYAIDNDRCAVKDGIAEFDVDCFSPSEVWAQGGPIIEREGMHILCWSPGSKNPWIAATTKPASRMTEDNYYPDGGTGPTPLVAAMRCHVGQKLGDIVEIPEELC